MTTSSHRRRHQRAANWSRNYRIQQIWKRIAHTYQQRIAHTLYTESPIMKMIRRNPQ